MNLPQALYAIRWLVWDTFRQALASGVFWIMLALSTIAIGVCLSVGVQGGENPFKSGEETSIVPPGDLEAQKAAAVARGEVVIPGGEMTIGFGAFHIPFKRFRTESVRYIELLLAGGVADSIGVLLALVFTAGFVPTFLDPAGAMVILTKPVPRWALLLGKYLGVLVLVLLHTTVFVVGTWLALGVKTGVWDGLYLLCIPFLLLHFAIFFSFSVLLGVVTRSTVASVFGSILFWLMCWGMNYGRNVMLTAGSPGASGGLSTTVEVGYWVLPKPADLGLMLFDALQANDYIARALNVNALWQSGGYVPELSALTSVLFGMVMLMLASYELASADY